MYDSLSLTRQAFDLAKVNSEKGVNKPQNLTSIKLEQVVDNPKFSEAKQRVDNHEFGFLDPATPGYTQGILSALLGEDIKLWEVSNEEDESGQRDVFYKYETLDA